MPIEFAQPVAANFQAIGSQSANSENNRLYAQLAGAAQSRFASDRASAGREQLGYAQLNADVGLKQAALGLQASEAQARIDASFGLVRARAQAEMDVWANQLTFTARDNMELNRQRAVVGEIMSKMHSGELSEEEGYRMMGDAAPRVNSLEAKMKHTETMAKEQERRQLAELHGVKKKQIDNFLAWQEGEAEGKVVDIIRTEHVDDVAKLMRYAHPDIGPGTPEYEARSKVLAAQEGWTDRAVKAKDGTMVFEKQVKGSAGAGSGGAGGTGRAASDDKLTAAQVAMKAADAHFKELGKDATEQELANEVAKRMRILSGYAGGKVGEQEKQQTAVQAAQAARTTLEGAEAIFRESPNLGQGAKFLANKAISDYRELLRDYPPDKPRPKRILEKFDAILDRIEQFKAQAAVQAPQPGAQPQPPAGPQGERPMNWGESLAQDVGNVGRGVGRVARQSMREVQDTSIRRDIIGAAGGLLPKTLEDYLFGKE